MASIRPQREFELAAQLVQQRIEQVYRIPIVTRDIPDPLTGDLNGGEIHLDHAVTPEQRLFLLVHLFGHTVQWNLDPVAFEVGQPRKAPVDEVLMPGLMDYEYIAGQYALALMHEAGVTDFDQWLADYTACDRAYLAHYYRTGKPGKFEAFWKDGTPPLAELAIPPFQPTPHVFRSDGIVV